jgi:predicted enzyme related to lactoylglutathione lyase
MGDFYSKLLGWERTVVYDCAAAVSPDKSYIFVFPEEEDYVPPVWPEEQGKQQKMIHFDFAAADIESESKRAISLGAKLAETQYGGSQWITLLDPAGHPFCICTSGE